jgi:hypothetical protein
MLYGGETLDCVELRSALLRIPEISQSLGLAQRSLDRPSGSYKQKEFSAKTVDLLTLMNCDSENFRKFFDLHSTLIAAVKAGLKQRLSKNKSDLESLERIQSPETLAELLDAVVSTDPLLKSWFWPSLCGPVDSLWH